MTLRAIAEQAAREVFDRSWGECSDDNVKSDIADAIERVAREFAGKALRHSRLAHCRKHGQIPTQGCQVCSNGIAAAIAEAEKS